MKLSSKTKWIFALVILLLLAIVYIYKQYTENRMYELQVKSLQDTTKTFRNKNNELVSQNSAFAGTVSDLKEQVKYWEKTGDTLRTKINKSTRQITLLSQKLKVSGQGVPEIINRDTMIFVGTTKIDTPSYNIHTVDEFHEFNFAGNKELYAYEFKAYPKTELSMEDMGNKGTRVTAISRNPYVYEQEVRSVVVPYPKRTFWQRSKDILIGVVAASVAVALLK